MSNHSHYTVGCDAHKHYSVFAVFDSLGKPLERTPVNHSRGAIQAFLSELPPGTPVAVGAVSRYLAEASYWVLTKNEPYREPALPARWKSPTSLRQGQARA